MAQARLPKEVDSDWRVLAEYVLRDDYLGTERTNAFKSTFGVTTKVFNAIIHKIRWPADIQPVHVMMGLCWLKTYSTESVMKQLSGYRCRKTCRQYIKRVVRKLSKHMKHVVKWENRFRDKEKFGDDGRFYAEKTCKVTLDGTDYRVQEPTPVERKVHKGRGYLPYDPRFKSFKFNKAGLRYELCVCIRTGDIVWVNGPYPAGCCHDFNIYKSKLQKMIPEGEMVEADNGYIGCDKIRIADEFVSKADRRAKSKARSRHEHVNGILKKYGVLKQIYRHKLRFHRHCFAAVVTVVQMSFDEGEEPWQVKY